MYEKAKKQMIAYKEAKRGFTLVELIVVMSVIAVLVLLAAPRFMGQTDKAIRTKHIANAKQVEEASERYYVDEGDWPRLTDDAYDSEEVAKYSSKIYDLTGEEVQLDPDGNYYDIDYDKLDKYVKVDDADKNHYILQNPKGKVFYLEQPDKEWPSRVWYGDSEGEDDESNEDRGDIPAEYVLVGNKQMPKNEWTNPPIPKDYVLVGDDDFEFVRNSSAPNAYDGVRGYYKYIGSETNIIIPEKIDGNVLRDYYQMFSGYTSSNELKVASTSDSVTNMRQMFYDISVPSVNASHLNTSNVTNMSLMFQSTRDNRVLKKIDVSGFDTSKVQNMYAMFYYSKAEHLDLSSFDTSKVTTMSQIFQSSTARTINISSFDMSNVTNKSNMFHSAKASEVYVSTLTLANKFQNMGDVPSELKFRRTPNDDFEFVRNSSAPNTYDGVQGYYKYIGSETNIIIPEKIDGNELRDYYQMFSGYTSSNELKVASTSDSVTNMRQMFYDISVPSVNASHLNTSNVTNMSLMFQSTSNNRALKKIDVSGFDTSKVQNMYAMFYYSKAEHLDLSSFDTSKVTTMSQIFQSSTAKTINISSFDMSNVTNKSNMFHSAKASEVYVSTLTLANKFQNMDNVPSGLKFRRTPNDDFEFVRNNSAPNIYDGVKGYYKYIGSETNIIIPEKIDGNVLRDYYQMFSGYTSSNELKVASTSDSVTNMRQMFYDISVPSVNASHLNTSNVTNMSLMFQSTRDNRVLKKIDVSGFDTSKVQNMYAMFYYSKVEYLDLSSFDTSKVTTMSQMFQNSTAKTINISSFDMSNVTNKSNMFDGTTATIIR